MPQQAQDRLQVLARIEEYEKAGLFDRDVEVDPPSRPIEPGEVDWTGKKWTTRVATRFANHIALRFINARIRDGSLVIAGVEGIENYLACRNGPLLLTANHFNPFDNFAIFKAIEPYLSGHDLWRVIREGNYTNFPGLYGFFFRHCNTLPVASRLSTMKEMNEAVATLFARGEKILIYPEQGMWWNYRKPRPLKLGAFRFAAKSGVPSLPVFLTMQDTEKIGPDGFPIQSYTVHFCPAVYPDPDAVLRENCERMATATYRAFRDIYERVYQMPLTYTTQGEVPPCCI